MRCALYTYSVSQFALAKFLGSRATPGWCLPYWQCRITPHEDKFLCGKPNMRQRRKGNHKPIPSWGQEGDFGRVQFRQPTCRASSTHQARALTAQLEAFPLFSKDAALCWATARPKQASLSGSEQRPGPPPPGGVLDTMAGGGYQNFVGREGCIMHTADVFQVPTNFGVLPQIFM